MLIAVLVGMVAVLLAGAWTAGFLAPRDDATLARLFYPWAAGPLVRNMLLAVAINLGTAVLVGIVVQYWSGKKVDILSPGQLVAISCVASAGTLAWLLIGLKSYVPGGFWRLGLIWQGVGITLKTAGGLWLFTMPLVMLISMASDWVYKWFDYQHESAHELLTAMDQAGGWLTRLGVLVAAVVLAPLAEELLFRGHLQTLLRRWLTPAVSLPGVAPMPAPPASIGPYVVPAVLPFAKVLTELPSGFSPAVARPFWPSAVSVVVTSGLFMAVHPLWSWPPIFVLALILGFAYERRGNLWVCVLLHAMFNATQTMLFLLPMGK